MDMLIGFALTAGVSIAGSFMLTMFKKGEFESLGKKTGKWVSRFARFKLGKGKWEKLEDTLTLAVLSFAKGFKLGCDSDDALTDDQLRSQMEVKKNG